MERLFSSEDGGGRVGTPYWNSGSEIPIRRVIAILCSIRANGWLPVLIIILSAVVVVISPRTTTLKDIIPAIHFPRRILI